MEHLLLVQVLSGGPAAGLAGVLIHLLIVVIVLGLVFWLVWWALNYLPLPAPFNQVVRFIVVLILISALWPLLGIA